jgi:hypothetical protein
MMASLLSSKLELQAADNHMLRTCHPGLESTVQETVPHARCTYCRVFLLCSWATRGPGWGRSSARRPSVAAVAWHSISPDSAAAATAVAETRHPLPPQKGSCWDRTAE